MVIRSPNPGIAPTNVGVPEGQVLADDGKLYTSVQSAENAASDTIVIGAGTFNEAITVDTTDLSVIGSGTGTLIDGGSNIALQLDSNNCFLTGMNLKSTNNQNNNIDAVVVNGTGSTLDSCRVTESDRLAFNISGQDTIITNCESGTNVFNNSFDINQDRCVLSYCFSDSTGGSGFSIGAIDDCIVSNSIALDSGGNGGSISCSDNIFISSRIINSSNDGIFINGGPVAADCIVANNRTSDSGNSDIDDSGTGTVLDANLTGASN